ncbi:hypothetical protein [Trichothermofontia sp.]
MLTLPYLAGADILSSTGLRGFAGKILRAISQDTALQAMPMNGMLPNIGLVNRDASDGIGGCQTGEAKPVLADSLCRV